MPETAPVEPQPSRDRRRFQFSLRALFLLTILISILAAAWAGMVRAAGPLPQRFYVLMAAAVPVILIILVGWLRATHRWLQRRRGRR